MKLNSIQLQAFQALCREQSFTKAAKSLALSQPAFSHRISSLEDELEVILFIRDKKGVILTQAGEELLVYTRKLEGLEDDFLHSFGGAEEGLAGVLRVGGFSSVMRSLILPALAPLMIQNEGLRLKTLTCELSELHSLLKSSQVDLVISNKLVANSNYHNDFLGYEENVLVCHKDFEHRDIYLDHDEQDVTTSSYFKLLGKSPPQDKLYLDDVYGLLDGVRLGLGKAVLPKHLIKNDKKMIVLRPRTILKVPVYLSYSSSPYYPKAFEEALEQVKKGLERQLAPK